MVSESKAVREILFRGKRNDNGNWIEGSLFTRPNRCYIFPLPITTSKSEVIPETVGQFTGLTDKNGKNIFEGDICRIGNLLYKVEFKYSCWWFTILSRKVYCCPAFNSHCGDLCEVIGNIHDNPELLEGCDG